MEKKSYLLILSLFLVAFSPLAAQEKFHYQGYTQGTYYNIAYFSSNEIVSQHELEIFLSNFMVVASLWESNSTIAKINRNESVILDSNFIFIFNKAKEISELTKGAFDITIGKLVSAWAIGYKEDVELSRQTIDSLLQYVGYEKIWIEDDKIAKKYPEITLDFNAIAKGYSVDLVANHLKNKGINNFIVDIGGEVRTSGRKDDGSDWLVGIEKPAQDKEADREIQYVVNLRDKSMATSGTYRKYREKDGVKYSHTIDPKTGYPVNHTLLSATVIAEECITADALATAFMVLGVENSLQFLSNHRDYEALLIFTDENGKLQTAYTKNFFAESNGQ